MQRPAAIGEYRAAVSLIEIPLAVRSAGQRVQRVVVIPAVESAEQHLAGIAIRRIEFQVAIDVGEFQQVRRLGNDDHIVEYRDAQR